MKINNAEIVKAQIINNNQHITIQNYSFYKKEITVNDMDLVGNWFFWNGTIKSWEQIHEKCSALTWLEYNQVVAAIPREWKRILKDRNIKSISLPEYIINKKDIKRSLNNSRSKKLNCDIIWDEYVLNTGNVLLNWPLQLKLIYGTTSEVKLQFFQYKIVAGIILTNTKKSLYGIEQSDKCSFCENHIGNIRHMYVECEFAIKIFRELLEIYNNIEHTNIEINKVIMLFFDETHHEHQHRLNLLTLWTRYYIYTCFISKTKPQVTHFKQVIKSRLRMLRAIARLEGNTDNYDSGWLNWNSWLMEKHDP